MALREINLIPEEILARRSLLRHLCFWTGCLVVSLTLIWSFHFYQSSVLQAKQRKVAKLKAMHKQLGAKIDEIKRIQGELDMLKRQQAGLESATMREPYSRVFAKLADIINDRTWLTQLTIDNATDEEAGASLRLAGFSFSNDELGNFLNRLSGEAIFKRVVLQHAREYEMSQSNRNARKPMRLIQFHIESNIARL
jgi:Tfp pilus assembly protein PilN